MSNHCTIKNLRKKHFSPFGSSFLSFRVTHPTEYFAIFKPTDPPIYISQLHKIRGSVDYVALKTKNIRPSTIDTVRMGHVHFVGRIKMRLGLIAFMGDASLMENCCRFSVVSCTNELTACNCQQGWRVLFQLSWSLDDL